MSCDILVFAPHPDDAEIHCGATIASHTRRGATVHVVDATRGELGSRGSAKERASEMEKATAILGIQERENLDLGDGCIQRDHLQQRNRIVDCIRRHQPQIVLGISPYAHHPDHRALADALMDAIKACCLHKLPEQHHPATHQQRLLCYEAELPPKAECILLPCNEADWQRKMDAIACYGSQVAQTNAGAAKTSIGRKAFLDWVEARGKQWGYQAEAPYAEAFHVPLHHLAIDDLRQLWPAYELE